tara:strand:- start:2004 stop:3167 length:1164 start_codon:yes stop_codon:yes gene_type:complete
MSVVVSPKAIILLENSNNVVFEAVIHNTCNYIEEHHFTIPGNRTKYKREIKVAIKPGQYTFQFEGAEIHVEYRNVGHTLSVEGHTKYHKELEITSNENRIDLLKEFIDDSVTFYNLHVLEKCKESDKLNLFLWDGDYWGSIKKKSKRSIDTVCYADNLHIKLLDEVSTFLTEETEKEYFDYGIPYKYNVLLEGYPGTGKTSLVSAIASELDLNIATLTFDQQMTDKCFFQALNLIPDGSILLLEDIDVLFKDRKENDTQKSALTFSGLLNALDGINSVHKLIVFMTTNYCCNLDNALKRPGRVDNKVHFGYSDKAQVQQMFNKFLGTRVDCFTEFYKHIKHYKLTSAILQKYLFENRNEPNLLTNIDDIKKVAESQKYDGGVVDMYS